MERKMVGELSMMIAMAKHIKACAKGLKEQNKVETKFNFSWFEDNTEISFQDKHFGICNNLSIEECKELTKRALSESGCNGVVRIDGNYCRVMLFGKPVKPFKLLQRLIKKYSGTDVEWNMIKTLDGDETRYLCYDDKECQKGIDFIRKFRTTKDVLKVGICYDYECRVLIPYDAIALRLIVETPHGKKKGEIVLVE